MTLTIASRFRGPSSSGNGGYVSGSLAEHVDAAVVTVTLRRPPPLDVTLDVAPADDGGVRLLHDGELVAEAVPGDDAPLSAVPAVSQSDASAAAAEYPGLRAHPFPECFVCGPSRAPGDGMRLFPGRLGDGRTACVWVPSADVTDESGAVPARFVWAALDCPGGWSAPIEGRPMVLGRLTAEVRATPDVGAECVVMGQMLGAEGRKTWTATTVYAEDGQVVGRAYATWITVDA
ncbi:hypothetical protein [Phytoactinopolyspora halotolerans]|uniref:Thioesterase family protein n=1 Tax=Phytoactinopolyspora halotolerans TaxID=1981512 RepID=A0A6L9S0I6_9ACTN|nr:hypothetical protein [Phytoactinopolyspora halotolerans]NED98954.1 hypothetical protein [Phytoactinopolyspora halotolerans]